MNLFANLWVLILILICSNTFGLTLTCSQNSTRIIYINGVYVTFEEFDDKKNGTKFNFNNILSGIKSEIDFNGKIGNVSGVYNLSRGLIDDIEELKSQMSANHTGKKREDYWKAKAKNLLYPSANYYYMTKEQQINLTSRVNKSIEQVTSKKFKWNQSIDQDYYSKTDEYNDLLMINPKIVSLIANASSDVAVVSQLKQTLLDSYSNGSNKVILISHSQGNEVAFSAVKSIREDFIASNNLKELEKFNKFVGYMQVAPPSPKLINEMSISGMTTLGSGLNRYIRLDNDLVIRKSEYLSEELGLHTKKANYSSDLTKQLGFDFIDSFIKEKSVLFGAITAIKNSASNAILGSAYHGMDVIYLSPTYNSTRNDTKVYQSMREHFKDNMREVASELADNCVSASESVLNGYSNIVSDLPTGKLSYSISNLKNYEKAKFIWSFGDGTAETYIGQSYASHSFSSYGTYTVAVAIYDSSNKFIKSFTIDTTIDPNKKISLVPGSTSYTLENIMVAQKDPYGNVKKDKDGNILYQSASTFHHLSAKIFITGPKGTGYESYFFEDQSPGGGKYSIDCGDWSSSISPNGVYKVCTRENDDPIYTEISLSKDVYCGGEGCFPQLLNNIMMEHVPILEDSPYVYLLNFP